jgi:hypothetical protein
MLQEISILEWKSVLVVTVYAANSQIGSTWISEQIGSSIELFFTEQQNILEVAFAIYTTGCTDPEAEMNAQDKPGTPTYI